MLEDCFISSGCCEIQRIIHVFGHLVAEATYLWSCYCYSALCSFASSLKRVVFFHLGDWSGLYLVSRRWCELSSVVSSLNRVIVSGLVAEAGSAWWSRRLSGFCVVVSSLKRVMLGGLVAEAGSAWWSRRWSELLRRMLSCYSNALINTNSPPHWLCHLTQHQTVHFSGIDETCNCSLTERLVPALRLVLIQTLVFLLLSSGLKTSISSRLKCSFRIDFSETIESLLRFIMASCS